MKDNDRLEELSQEKHQDNQYNVSTVHIFMT